jgi:DNA-binding response OmpR family regulator
MKKIIIVNAIHAFLERDKSILSRADFRIFTATSGKEALRIHQEEKVNLLVADLALPDMGGDVLCSLVRKESTIRNVSIILVCQNLPEELERVSTCGANAWVTKPVRPEQLVESVGQLLAVSLRRGYRVLLKAKVHGARENVSFFCTSHNISVSGILLETEKLLEPGNRITCTFFLPGSRQIAVDGEVVRFDKKSDGMHHYGVRFTDLAPEFREEIERFIAQAASLD